MKSYCWRWMVHMSIVIVLKDPGHLVRIWLPSQKANLPLSLPNKCKDLWRLSSLRALFVWAVSVKDPAPNFGTLLLILKEVIGVVSTYVQIGKVRNYLQWLVPHLAAKSPFTLSLLPKKTLGSVISKDPTTRSQVHPGVPPQIDSGT